MTPDANATIEALNAEVAHLQSTATSPAVATPTIVPPAAPTSAATTVVAAVPTAVPTATVLALEDAIAFVKSYTAYLWTDDGAGSGISLGNGRILTAFHVVQGANTINARFADGRQEPVRVMRSDPRRDLALLRTSFADLPAASLRDARAMRDGEALVAVGFPRSDAIGARDTTVTRGIVSGRWQSPQGVWYVQTDTPVNPGNSGGPLTDSHGLLVGVVTFGVRQAIGLNFAVASDEVQAFLNGSDVQPAETSAAANVQLSSTAITPTAANPGAVLTLSYDITYDGRLPLTLVLGASVRPKGGSWINDPLEDIRVTLRPGQAKFTRQFHLPSTADAGPYDVAWGLLGTDMRTSYGLITQPAALMVIRTSAPTAVGPLDAAIARVSQEGYRTLDTSSYKPSAEIRVLLGVASASAEGANHRAFFFAGERYLGTDASDPSAHVGFVRQDGNTITLRYVLFRLNDPQCCPSAGTADVRFRWDGAKLSPLDPIPSSDPKAPVSRR